MKINLSVLTVVHNNETSILKYLQSIEKHLPPKSEVIIVDCLSTDSTTSVVKNFQKKFDRKKIIKLLEPRANLGFSKGSNLAFNHSKGEYILILNPDTEIKDDSVKKLLNFSATHPHAGVVAPTLVNFTGKAQKSVKRLPTLWRVIKEYYLGQRHVYNEYIPQGQHPIEVESVYGAAMLIKRPVYERLNGFDRRYFLYYEDLDFCRRVGKLGYKIIYYPKATVIHQVGGSFMPQQNLSKGLRVLSWFFPIKKSGRIYYQLKSSNTYHGLVVGFLIRVLIYLSIKLRIYKE